jgi:outer membrane receptor for ferrienterochelin and colicins
MSRLIFAAFVSFPLPFISPGFAQSISPPDFPLQAESDRKEPNIIATPKVVVREKRGDETDQRRLSTASKLIFGREELDKNGDSTVTEILKRLPGVTLGGRAGRGGEVRMRGLGGGYTQILLNGERPPGGFSLDSVPPDQIERIEIIRGTVAEFSTQAVAGTINVVLREGYTPSQGQTQWRLGDSVESGNHSPRMSVTHSGDAGSLAYSVTTSVFQNDQTDLSTGTSIEANGAGVIQKDRTQVDQSERRRLGMNISPRLNFRLNGGNTLTVQPFIVASTNKSSGTTQLTDSVGIAPYSLANNIGDADSHFARLFGNYVYKIDGGGRVDAKFGFGNGRSDSDTVRKQFDNASILLRTLTDNSQSEDSNVTFGGKFSSPLGDGHTFALGWDAELFRRSQQNISLANGVPRFASSGDDFDSRTRRLAAFVQDEWDVSKPLSVYFGVRWEGVQVRSESSTVAVKNSSSVISPVAHGVWRLPTLTSSGRDQVRLSLTKSYRPPTLADLIALPSFADVNTPTTPDRTGNSQLKPELATGVDLAFEHYFSRGGQITANVFRRDITNLIRRTVTLQNDLTGTLGPRWVSQPTNLGRAKTSGIEIEAKTQLSEFIDDAPAIDVRFNYSRFWSDVEGIPGPNNRLDNQAKQTANLGLDYRLTSVPLTLGGGLNWTPGYEVQTSTTQAVRVGVKRQFDFFGAWKFSPSTQLRLSANNISADDSLGGATFTDVGISQFTSNVARTFTVWSLRLELKL